MSRAGMDTPVRMLIRAAFTCSVGATRVLSRWVVVSMFGWRSLVHRRGWRIIVESKKLYASSSYSYMSERLKAPEITSKPSSVRCSEELGWLDKYCPICGWC